MSSACDPVCQKVPFGDQVYLLSSWLVEAGIGYEVRVEIRTESGVVVHRGQEPADAMTQLRWWQERLAEERQWARAVGEQ
jgi:hypothetical protein